MFPVVLYQYTPPLFFKGPQRKQSYTASLCYPCHRTLWRTFLPQFSLLMNLYLYTLKILDLLVMVKYTYLLIYKTLHTFKMSCLRVRHYKGSHIKMTNIIKVCFTFT